MIEEEEKQGSSSDSSACIVGTTTQGPENSTPPKGQQSDLNMAGRKPSFHSGFMAILNVRLN